MKRYKAEKALKWYLEGVPKEEIKRRLKEHRIGWRDGFRDMFLD